MQWRDCASKSAFVFNWKALGGKSELIFCSKAVFFGLAVHFKSGRIFLEAVEDDDEDLNISWRSGMCWIVELRTSPNKRRAWSVMILICRWTFYIGQATKVVLTQPRNVVDSLSKCNTWLSKMRSFRQKDIMSRKNMSRKIVIKI